MNALRTIDFTKSHWGHALHAFTFTEEPQSLVDRLFRIRRYSVMVHCSPDPSPGDHVRYNAANGEKVAEVSDVIPCGNPDDMFTLKLRLPVRPNR